MLTRRLLVATLAACPNCTLVESEEDLVYREDLLERICDHFEVTEDNITSASQVVCKTVLYMTSVYGATRAQIADEARHLRNLLPLSFCTNA
jgi:hypothetical protein